MLYLLHIVYVYVMYIGVEAARQGQMEARERLLSEMEQRAKERSEAAETESYRLKGMLVHMEGVVGQLRAQSGEEKERLRLEHNRLQSLQVQYCILLLVLSMLYSLCCTCA